jgi:hypothetical protein
MNAGVVAAIPVDAQNASTRDLETAQNAVSTAPTHIIVVVVEDKTEERRLRT